MPIQPRTSPLKFDHSVEKLGVEYGIISLNLDRDRADGGGHAHAGGDPRLRAARGVLAHPLEQHGFLGPGRNRERRDERALIHEKCVEGIRRRHANTFAKLPLDNLAEFMKARAPERCGWSHCSLRLDRPVARN